LVPLIKLLRDAENRNEAFGLRLRNTVRFEVFSIHCPSTAFSGPANRPRSKVRLQDDGVALGGAAGDGDGRGHARSLSSHVPSVRPVRRTPRVSDQVLVNLSVAPASWTACAPIFLIGSGVANCLAKRFGQYRRGAWVPAGGGEDRPGCIGAARARAKARTAIVTSVERGLP
jgi:hypothetical protein